MKLINELKNQIVADEIGIDLERIKNNCYRGNIIMKCGFGCEENDRWYFRKLEKKLLSIGINKIDGEVIVETSVNGQVIEQFNILAGKLPGGKIKLSSRRLRKFKEYARWNISSYFDQGRMLIFLDVLTVLGFFIFYLRYVV